jgi:hypothetical protein
VRARLVSGLYSLGNSTFVLSLTTSSFVVNPSIDLNSAILSEVVFIFLNKPTNVLPLALHTQQCHGFSPFRLGTMFTSSFGLW